VIDGVTNSVSATIPVGPNPLGIAVFGPVEPPSPVPVRPAFTG